MDTLPLRVRLRRTSLFTMRMTWNFALHKFGCWPTSRVSSGHLGRSNRECVGSSIRGLRSISQTLANTAAASIDCVTCLETRPSSWLDSNKLRRLKGFHSGGGDRFLRYRSLCSNGEPRTNNAPLSGSTSGISVDPTAPGRQFIWQTVRFWLRCG